MNLTMMKLELNQHVGIKAKVEYLLDVLTDAVVNVSDFLAYKHIKLSEGILFGLAFCRAIWFLFFGVENANYGYFFPDWVWIIVFVTAAGIHSVGFFGKTCALRIVAAYFYTGIWGFLTVLAVLSKTSAPAVPTLGVLALISFLMIIRLSRENSKLEC